MPTSKGKKAKKSRNHFPKRVSHKPLRSLKPSSMKKASKKVLPIPKGYHSITPYLIIEQASKAIEFYKKAFGAKEVLRMEQPGNKIGHAELMIGDSKIMLADECPEMNIYSSKKYGGSPMGIHLYVKEVDKVVEGAVKAGAKLVRAVENMFYGDRSGAVEDPYGYQWYISMRVEELSLSEIRKRAAQLFNKK